MTQDSSATDWQLNLRRAEATIESALAQRTADRRNPEYAPNEWAHVSLEIYGWSRAKTYLAAVLCGLVARATDERANPLSLQVGGLPGGYAATTLWQSIQAHAQGRIDLKHLKSQPFNNSPFTGKRQLASNWENVAGFNRPRLERTVELMERVAMMSSTEAREALRSFLFAAPDAHGISVISATVAEGSLDLPRFFAILEEFLLDDGENGRRAQAMVAAALALVHGERVDTPQSVNDPSRGLPGDVRVASKANDEYIHALFAEAKQKVTEPEWVHQFAEEVRLEVAGGTTAYGALVNDRAAVKGRRFGNLPDWRDILDEHGVVSVIWANPAEMVRDAIVWSALAAPVAVVRFVELLAGYLVHVEAEVATVEQWRSLAAECGITTQLADE